MTDAFIFLTRQPKKMRRLLSKFHEATQRATNDFDFHICTYDEEMEQLATQVSVGGQSFRHWIFGRKSAFSLGYPQKVNQKNWFLIPGNCDIPILAFFRSNGDYARYWVVEDDVDFSGDLTSLIDDLSKNRADLQCSHVQRGWSGWTYNETLKTGMAEQVDPSETRLCFLPFFVISQQALSALDTAYRNGWAGHHEQTWPTILQNNDLTVLDIGGTGEFVEPEYIDRYYFGMAKQNRNKTGSFIPTPPRLFVGSKPNTLWHPVKPFGQWLSGTIRRWKSIATYYLNRLKS